MPSTEAVNRGYWDPSESMRTLAEEIVANDRLKPIAEQQYADITAVTQENYFSIAAKERIGAENQTVQFQSGDQYGTDWFWGSRLNEAGEVLYSIDGNQTAINADPGNGIWHQGGGVWIEHNSRDQMPRAYDNGPNTWGTYYNWYAATAEAGDYGTSGTVEDSICPAGWKLPVDDDSSNNDSWLELLFSNDTYAFAGNSDSSKSMRQVPLSFTLNGYYNLIGTLSRRGSYGYFRSATASSTSNARTLYLISDNVYPQNGYNKGNGVSVRCLLE